MKNYKIDIPNPLQNNYFDYEKVFTKEFRNCDNMLSLLTDDELNETIVHIEYNLLNTISLKNKKFKVFQKKIEFLDGISYSCKTE